MQERDAMIIFEETRALRDGHFELRSGLHSNRFFQCALVLQYPDRTARLCKALIARAPEPVPDVVIAPALGGVTVGYEIGRQYGARAIFAEKGEGNRLVLRRGFDLSPGEKVIIAEDVITRGGRVQEIIDMVEARSGTIVGILVLVDRSGGRATFAYPLHSLVRWTPETWDLGDCPLCAKGLPLEHPGS